jgi:5'-3' exonuclease
MKFLAVDLSSVFRRNWEAAEGQQFGEARTRTVRQIQGLADGYDRIVVARDAPSFRYGVYRQYKANRTDPGEAFRDQQKACVADLKEVGATVWVSPCVGEHEGRKLYGEADDVIASFAMWYQDELLSDPPNHEGWALTIYTGDRDLWALVDDALGISVLTLDGKEVRCAQVLEAPDVGFGVPPGLVAEAKALTGDKSDNYGGFPGLGGKTAAAILTCGIELGEKDRSAADVVFRSVVAGIESPVKLNKTIIESIRSGGFPLLNLGRQLATLRPQLRRIGDAWEPIDFSSVLAEPMMVPRRGSKGPALETSAEQTSAESARPSTALAVAEPKALAVDRSLPFAPQLQKMMRFAQEMYESGVFRSTLGNPASCLMLCEYARAFRVPAVILAQHTNLVKGKIGFGAQVIMSIILAHPSTRAFRFTGDLNSAQEQHVKYHRVFPDGDEEKGVYRFDIAMAQRAGYLDGKHSEQWLKRPSVMLGWAAARECARKVWPDVTVGFYGADELRSGGMVDDQGDIPDEMVQEPESGSGA